MADGSWLVAYEGNHRIAAHSAGWRGLLAEPELAHLPPETAELPANQGIESIAVAADGTLAILAETTGEDGSSPAWLRRDGGGEPRRYRPEPGFVPTDAVFLPPGDLLDIGSTSGRAGVCESVEIPAVAVSRKNK